MNISFCKYETIKIQRFYKKYNLKNDTMNEFQLQKIYIYHIDPRDSKLFSNKGFVNLDDGSQGGTHWTAFYAKNNRSFCFDSFGGQPDKFILNQIPKPIIYHNYKFQDINSRVCGSYCFYFYLIERTNYYDVI